MADLIYANGKLSAGITKLATHPGRIKDRLIAAFSDSLLQVPEKVLPEEARVIWKEVMNRVATGEIGSLASTIKALDEQDAVDIAHQIATVASLVGCVATFKK